MTEQSRLREEITTLFGPLKSEAEQKIQERFDEDKRCREFDAQHQREYDGDVDLKEVLEILKATHAIHLDALEVLLTRWERGGRQSTSFQVEGKSKRCKSLHQLENKKTEPIYVYSAKKARNHT